MKRVVSFVPSWTETLIEAGANVVGRTRFCIHPAERVRAIEAIGGTKSFDEAKLRALEPDLIIMDREENTREMNEVAQKIAPVLVTHVQSVRDVARELRAIAEALKLDVGTLPSTSTSTATSNVETSALCAMASRFDAVLSRKRVLHNGSPGLIKQVKGETSAQTEFVYLIWKDPWMCVTKDTFIGSMLAQVGYTHLWAPEGGSKYPVVENLPGDKMVFLSSEPYPFAKKTPLLPNENVAIVDGESFSWFGIRALRFLEG